MTPEPERRRAGLVTLVVPAKNEEAAIGHTLRSLPVSTLAALGHETEVFVLDGNSHDATPAIGRSWGATVVSDPEPGKGSALRHARSRFRGDYVIMLDADGTYAPDTIPLLVSHLADHHADVVMGYRRPQPGSMPPVNEFGNAVFSLAASLLYRRRCPDLCTGLWGFRGDVLRFLPLQSRGFGLEAELFAISSRLGLRIAHVPVDYLPRRGPTKLHVTRDGLRILRRILRSRFVPLPSAALRAAKDPHDSKAPSSMSSDAEVGA